MDINELKPNPAGPFRGAFPPVDFASRVFAVFARFAFFARLRSFWKIHCCFMVRFVCKFNYGDGGCRTRWAHAGQAVDYTIPRLRTAAIPAHLSALLEGGDRLGRRLFTTSNIKRATSCWGRP